MRSLVLVLLIGGCAREASGPTYAQAKPPGPSASPLGEWVQGDDGTLGWRTATRGAPQLFASVSDRIAKRCTIESRNDMETRANCSGVPVMARHDKTNLYRVCASGTVASQCVATWNAMDSTPPSAP